MSFFAVSALVNAVTSFLVAVFVLTRNPRAAINRSFFCFSISVCMWSGVYCLWQVTTHDQQLVLFLCQLFTAFSVLIPSTFFHFAMHLIRRVKEEKFLINLFYFISAFFYVLSFTPYMVVDVRPRMGFVFWPTAGKAYPVFILFFMVAIVLAQVFMCRRRMHFQGFERQQIKYVSLGALIGFVGGTTNFPLWFDIPIAPIGNVLVPAYVFLIAYAIVRYRLMDIRLAISRAGIFFTVYTFVLGVPVWLGFKMFGFGVWIWPVALMGILATIGPSIFISLQRRAEARLLAEQRRYQHVLRQASAGMGHIRDLDRLYKLIAHILTRTVLMESALIYTVDDKGGYRRVACRFRKDRKKDFLEFAPDSLMVQSLHKLNGRIFIDELRFRTADKKSSGDDQLVSLLNDIGGSLVLGVFIDNKLDTFVVMGPKSSAQPYTEDDLAVFSILINQAALAIENAHFYDNMQRTQKQLFRAEKMAMIGTMADGVSHQINNRFHAMGFIAGDVLDTINLYEKDPQPHKSYDIFAEIRTGLKRIEENVNQGSQVVRGLLDYSRNDTKTEKEGVDVHKLLQASLDMVSLKVHLKDFERVIDVPLDVPHVIGNFVQLQEVFFNIIDNAHFSMMDKKSAGIEAGYKPCMKFLAEVNGDKLRIIVTDNGMGIKEDDQKRLFTPFFTTKVSSRKGNGLGLYVMRKIIEEDHGGSIKFSSNYLQGVDIEILLPLIGTYKIL